MFQIFDYYAASGMVLLFFCFTECVAVSWVYGVNNWHRNVEDMVGHRVLPWLKICWFIITPAITLGLLASAIINYQPLKYREDLNSSARVNSLKKSPKCLQLSQEVLPGSRWIEKLVSTYPGP